MGNVHFWTGKNVWLDSKNSSKYKGIFNLLSIRTNLVIEFEIYMTCCHIYACMNYCVILPFSWTYFYVCEFRRGEIKKWKRNYKVQDISCKQQITEERISWYQLCWVKYLSVAILPSIDFSVLKDSSVTATTKVGLLEDNYLCTHVNVHKQVLFVSRSCITWTSSRQSCDYIIILAERHSERPGYVI